ncbi:DUF6221 family protein [Nocardia abscessus]|uniref:DUF6221 family protein n=1 Tax=Nocardia abscessus TaxID=120957 RepID=UPI000301B21A|nr:DUF6221 family protein [Nocardia abscessus]MCC3333577.1 DUF6221 family protein [Nocardia abscessus]
MIDIEDFIAARLAEDEQQARWAVEGPARIEPNWDVMRYEQDGTHATTVADSSGVFLAPELGRLSDHIARHDPAHVLRQCTAIRLLMRDAGSLAVNIGTPSSEMDAMFAPIAAIWSDHPDYQSEWKPQ